MAPGTGPWGQVPPGPAPGAAWGPPGPVPAPGRQAAPPKRSGSIVADLDVPERDLNERPRRLVPGSMALVLVCLLVLGIAGGGGYLAWERSQAQPTLEPTVEPEAVTLPPVEGPEAAPVPVDPAVPGATTSTPTGTSPGATPGTTPTTSPGTTPGKTDPAPTKTGTTPTTKPPKTKSESGSSTPKKPPAEKTGSSSKTGSGGTKKADPAEELAKRKDQADAADPGRVLVELEYLSAIDKALKAGNWAQALAYIDQHDKELPGGQLVDKFDERRIRALCGMGRASEAQAKVTQILAKRPSSKVKTALAESCK